MDSMDSALWKIENFLSFMEARKKLLATELNLRMEELLHGDTKWLAGPAAALPVAAVVSGGVSDEMEEAQLETLSDWMESQGLPRGTMSFDFADSASGKQKAVFDLAWPSGIQEELSQPVAVLLNENNDTIAVASQAGFRCFTSIADFKKYVQSEVLAEEATI